MTTKAIRATIKLGSIELSGYQLPDGKYILSKAQVVKAVSVSPKRLSELLETKALRTHMPQGLRMSGKIKVEGGTKPIDPIELDEAAMLWQYLAITGNETAQLLSYACMAEALERRLDAAFGVKRTEQERQDLLEARVDHKDGWRKNFTSWQKLDGCVDSRDYAKRVRELKAYAKLPIDTSIEDYSSKQGKIMVNAEVVYDAMRRIGKTHQEALQSL